MSIGRTFKESLQKALRSLEIGRAGFGADGKDASVEALSDEELAAGIRRPHAKRLFYIHAAFRRGWSVEKIFDLSKIDPWFLRHLEELAAFEDEIRSAGSLDSLAKQRPLLLQAKQFGYSTVSCLASGRQGGRVRALRFQLGVTPSFSLVDTCAAEFQAFTPYFYSTYVSHTGATAPAPVSAQSKQKIMILGGGPNRIGQGIEFDYCCVHACFALRAAGFETVMVNSNPRRSAPITTRATNSTSSRSLWKMCCTSTGRRGAAARSRSSAGRRR